MSLETQNQKQLVVITLQGDDGLSYKCLVIDFFEFESNEYVLIKHLNEELLSYLRERNIGHFDGDDLVSLSEEEHELISAEMKDDPNSIVMRWIQKGDQSIFQTIENEEEFQRVVAHVEELLEQLKKEGY